MRNYANRIKRLEEKTKVFVVAFVEKNEEGAYVCHVAGQEGELIFQTEEEYQRHFDGDVLFVRFENYGKIWTATE